MYSTIIYNPRRLTGGIYVVVLIGLGIFVSGCDSVFGGKQDDVTNEIFEEAKSDPTFISDVEYVPLFPFFTDGANGMPFDQPADIYPGFDELIYVVDKAGLHILDSSGRPAGFVAIPGGGTSVTQDRRLHVYVTARQDTLINGRTWSLPVVYRFDELNSGTPRLANTIWHPFDDDSRKFTRPDPIDTDEEVSFTGVGILFNNDIYVSRRGPVNTRGSIILPHNTIMQFTPDGVNTKSLVALHSTRPSLRSTVFPADIITFVHPPQQSAFEPTLHFIVAQSAALKDVASGDPVPDPPLRFPVLSIRAVLTSDGIEFQTDTPKLVITGNPDAGDGFLYDDFKYTNPTDLTFAADGTNYIFVLDGGSDSLFVFTNRGIEGVAPPVGANSAKPVIVSFGGTGDGSTQFRSPLGVGYAREIVYVADTGNNRISRFKLNTDFE